MCCDGLRSSELRHGEYKISQTSLGYLLRDRRLLFYILGIGAKIISGYQIKHRNKQSKKKCLDRTGLENADIAVHSSSSLSI